MDTLNRIKATATNRGKARIWIERDLSKYGFQRHSRVQYNVTPDYVECVLHPEGDRVMAGRERNGKAIQIVDLSMPIPQREELRRGCAKFLVQAEQGRILITPDLATKEA